MKVGGERILQIPSAMAYGQGDLVFRVHLESLIDAPYGHTLTFEGTPPTEVEVTTVVEGSGPGAEVGDAVDANVTVLYYSTSQIAQSTWEDGATTSLFLATRDASSRSERRPRRHTGRRDPPDRAPDGPGVSLMVSRLTLV